MTTEPRKWAIAPWNPKSLLPEPWAREWGQPGGRGKFEMIHTASEETAQMVLTLLDAASRESVEKVLTDE